MTQSTRFDDRARQLTHGLLADAERVPARHPRLNSTSRLLRGVVVFAVTVLVIGGAVVGSSLVLHGSTTVGPSEPAPGHSIWSAAHIDSKSDALRLSCPSADNCVVVDNVGNVITSTNPTGGTAAWNQFVMNDTVNLTGVSCPTPSLCVAVDQIGDIFTSTNPSGGAAAWKLIAAHFGSRPGPSPPVSGFNAVSCSETTFCVAVGGADQGHAGQVAMSTDPTSFKSWRFTNVGFPDMTSVSCPGQGLCVAVGGGELVTFTDDGTAWTFANVAGVNTLIGVSCPTTSLCVAVDAAGDVVTSTNPTGGVWTVTDADGSRRLTAISCASENLCVAGDSDGSVIASTNPTGGATAWTRTQVTPGHAITAVSCPVDNFCAITNDAGSVHASSDPG